MSETLLKVEKMTRRFGGLTAVSDLSFEVRRGEILGLIGPNGAGKSTTFNVVSGFYRASEGRLTFDGQDITAMKPAQVCQLGLVRTFQHDSYLREMTVHDNLLIATFSQIKSKAEREKRVQETAELLKLTDHMDELAGSLPHGLQRMVGIGIAFKPFEDVVASGVACGRSGLGRRAGTCAGAA